MISSSILILGFVIVYCLILFSVAFLTSRKADNESFFIGNKSSHWALVAFGMIGTSLSGITFISVPGTVGTNSFGYFQVVLGYFIGYLVISNVLLPLYYKMQLTSIYTYLMRRFNDVAYKSGATIFIVSRALGATLRLYVVIMVLQKFLLDGLNISFETTSFLVVLLIVLYTFKGGVKTIVWTDTLQTTFMLLALVVCFGFIANDLDLSIFETIPALAKEGYSKVFVTDWNSNSNFVKSILGGALITITMTGLDQEMMQKNISVAKLKDSQKNMFTFSIVLVLVNLLFLILGGMLYLYAEKYGIVVVEKPIDGALTPDQLFPYFALKSAVPISVSIIFIIGLVSALFPSADGALTALTSSFCIDILDFKKSKDSIKTKTTVRIVVHFIFAIIFYLLILYFRDHDNGMIIQKLLGIATYTYGPLLGMFSFGILTKRMPKSWAFPLVSILCPLLCYVLKISGDGTYSENSIIMNNSWLKSTFDSIRSSLHGYEFGLEILLINGLLTFLILFIFSKKGTNDTAAN